MKYVNKGPVNKAPSTIIDAGLVQAHIGTRAATINWPNVATRVILDDIPKLKALLDRIAKGLLNGAN